MDIIGKNSWEERILPDLTIGPRGFDATELGTEIVESILHQLKTGC